MALADILGIEVIESTPNKYVTHMLVTEDMLQPHGVLHGGISAALAENAASECCTEHYEDENFFFLGVEVRRYGKKRCNAHSCRWTHFSVESRTISFV